MKNTHLKLSLIVAAYLRAVEWSSVITSDTDVNDCQPADSFGADFSDADEKIALDDCEKFIARAGSLLDNLDESTIGHCFALDRGHHGCGFMDEKEISKEDGRKLADLAQTFGAWQCVGITPDGKYYYVEG